jgi:hypothetical protein
VEFGLRRQRDVEHAGTDRVSGSPIAMSGAPGVFITYRREDASGHAGWLYEALSERFGEDRVFMDVAIPPAVDFVAWIEDHIGSAGVLIVIIGRTWLAASDSSGKRRLDDERDFVRREIAGALDRGIRVVPVLVSGAQMPSEQELPSARARLARINALEIRDGPDWRIGRQRLIETVADLLGEKQVATAPERVPRGRLRISAAIALVGTALLALGLVVLADVYITPGFKHLPVAAGVFTGAAPIGILLGAFLAIQRLLADELADWLGVGLIAAFGYEAAAKGTSILGDSAGSAREGGVLWLAGGAVLAAAAAVGATAIRGLPGPRAEPQRRRPGSLVSVLLILGGASQVVGAVIPFNVATPGGNRVVVEDSLLGVEPIATALGILAAVAMLSAARPRFVSGLLIALGLSSALLWVRYVGIPVAQWLNVDGVASPQAGGLVGLGGALVVLATGCWLAASERAEAPASRPIPTQ